MGNSWGHAIEILDNPTAWDNTCHTGRGCKEPARFMLSFCYITGRAGRVSDQHKAACIGHAERYAAKHGLSIPHGPIRRASAPKYRPSVAGELFRQVADSQSGGAN